MRTSRAYMPIVGFGMSTKYVSRKSKKGSGVGSVLLDGGMGGQSSYSSMDDYLGTVKKPIIGLGVKGLDKIRGKMEGLAIRQPPAAKPKNIRFNF
jgi:hypothetical protein